MKLSRKFLFILIALLYTTVLAQATDCADMIQQAISRVQGVCAAAGRNQACYGNTDLEATTREGVAAFNFSQQGDLVNVADVSTLRLEALDPASDVWGMALMKIQANLPDTLPGQNVTFLLFGDVQIENAVESSPELVTLDVTTGSSLNVRSGPGKSYAVIGSLGVGDTAVVDGRSADNLWLRVRLPGTSALGWVSTPLVTATGDVNSLSTVDASEAEVPFTPMQAFYLRTGFSQPACAEAPQSGILIQTPEGAGEIMLRANDVDIQLGSTAYLQAAAGQEMTVSVVEGEAEVTSEGETVVVPAGSQVDIPMDENLNASGPPSEPEPYDAPALETLPVEVLPDEITIAPALSQEEIDQVNGTVPTQEPGAQVPDGLPGGLPMDPNAAQDMNHDAYCQYLEQGLAEAGMTRESYLAMLQQAMANLPGDLSSQFSQMQDQFASCP